ncbi:class I SAM-dependent methyltransferase [Actinoallomurus soli]|uniref:class I SAM-dependent methyltransferase n=1 Tax=Actinoallomurus soli TaxID=2952535 RepID=UPI002092688D|nr:class I SAM-dependent methyltransferase [Actinoallomurus soli]MCO5973856.1 class I SAM-dependent methyltransferase [Actinoallomurus soli]
MPPAPHRATLARSVRLLRAFRDEQSDPEGFYRLLAADTIAQLGRYASLDGATVADVGSGPGFFTTALRRAGARCVGVECDAGELTLHGPPPPGTVLGTALSLPLATGSVDVCFSSNVLEHVPGPWRMGAEMIRVVRPGGVVFLAFTNWLSPWGGHETSPWHYLGGHRAARRYERGHGRPPKNRYGHSLHPVSVGAALTWARGRDDVTVEAALPRYLPGWAAPVVRVPGVREFLTWNLLLVLRKTP